MKRETPQKVVWYHRPARLVARMALLPLFPALFLAVKTGNVLWGFVLLWSFDSLVLCWLYAADKAMACCGDWRIPERRLHLWALLGGWPGALYAQWKFRHKNRKTAFLVLFVLCILGNVLLAAAAFRCIDFGPLQNYVKEYSAALCDLSNGMD